MMDGAKKCNTDISKGITVPTLTHAVLSNLYIKCLGFAAVVLQLDILAMAFDIALHT